MAVRQRWNGTRPLPMSTAQVLERLLPHLDAQPRVDAVYLFGSRVHNRGVSDSDLDLAIATTAGFTADELFKLGGTLTRLAGSDRIDLLWLNRADPVVAFGVLRDGRLLHYRDADRLNALERHLTLQYRDHMLLLAAAAPPARWSTDLTMC